MKIAIGMFGEETNSFATGLFRTSMLDPDRWTDEKDLLSRFGGTQSYLGGMIRAKAVPAHPSVSTSAVSAATQPFFFMCVSPSVYSGNRRCFRLSGPHS